jgi:hypothetical protein
MSMRFQIIEGGKRRRQQASVAIETRPALGSLFSWTLSLTAPQPPDPKAGAQRLAAGARLRDH